MHEIIRSALLIAKLAFHEASRKRLVSILFIFGALLVGFYLFGIYQLEDTLRDRSLEAGIEQRQLNGAGNLPIMFAVLAGMNLVYFLGSLMSVLSTVGAISHDLETGVIQSMLARPISRSGFVLGKWLGFAAVNLGYIALMSLGVLGGMYLITGYFPPESLVSVGLIGLAMLVLTSLTILGSTIFTTLANGIGVFVLYSVGFIGGILGWIGKISDTPLLETLSKIANVIMPTNALWLSAGYHLKSELLRDAKKVIPDPQFGDAPTEVWVIPWAILLCVLALSYSIYRMRHRDY